MTGIIPDCAVAIFARTPGQSAAKTRLAAEIGAQAATNLYLRALACAAELGHELVRHGYSVSWAVAEAGCEDDQYWMQTGLPAFSSGTGGLGERLAHVYNRLLASSRIAVLIGSDTPQLPAARVLTAVQAAAVYDYAAGPATDGGFYVFAGTRPVAKELWTQVTYSVATTLAELVKVLRKQPAMLPPETDLDNVQSLISIIASSSNRESAAWLNFVQEANETLAIARKQDPCAEL